MIDRFLVWATARMKLSSSGMGKAMGRTGLAEKNQSSDLGAAVFERTSN